ncbi:multicopper oxidase, partial [Peniophora sp. CONT]
NSTLINGLGRYNDPIGSDLTQPLAVVNVVKGTRYRMRLVSISCDPNFIFSIDQHQMTVIEADGNNVQPLVVDSIQIYAGQRYSFVLNADQKVDNYWIRSFPNTSSFIPEKELTFDNGLNSAILRYKGAKIAEPTTPNKPSVQPLVETNLHPLVPTPPPQGPADKTLNLQIALDLDLADNTGVFTINNATYTPPKFPVLLQILSGNTSAQSLVPEHSIYELEPNTTVDLVIPGGSLGGPHPMHLHGHAFWVLRSAGNSSYNYENPVLRDVVSVGNHTTDDVTIRFRTDNPGPWILHCHIDWHLAEGLAVVMAEDVNEIAQANRVPPSWEALCPAYDKFVAENPNAF